MPSNPATVWTIGHSTRTLEEFLALLEKYRIQAIADVRRFPGSRRHPHFASAAMAGALPAHGIAYQWIPKLGGRRKVLPDSPNTAWRNAAFQGYAERSRRASRVRTRLRAHRFRETVVRSAGARRRCLRTR